MSVVSLEDARIARSPHEEGTAKCLGCGHKWNYVRPYPPTNDNLECPECSLLKGVVYGLYEPRNPEVFTCNCGHQEFFIHPDDTFFCTKCGTVHER